MTARSPIAKVRFVRSILLATAFALSTGGQAQTVSTLITDIPASGGLSIGPDGKLYLSDFGSSLKFGGGQHIFRVEQDGSNFTRFASGFGGASGNSFDSHGNLYQSDVARGQVIRVSPRGERTVFGGGLQAPVGIVPDGRGGAYVAQCIAGEITHVNRAGSIRTMAKGDPLNCPNGLARGPSGDLYTVNFRDGALIRIQLPEGEMHVVARIPGGGNGHLAWANDRFYVASFRGHKIYSVTLFGEVCLIAGSGSKGNDDGPALAASFFRPNGVAVSSDGNSLFTNTITSIVERNSPLLHLNAVRRVEGLRNLLDCPAGRRIEKL